MQSKLRHNTTTNMRLTKPFEIVSRRSLVFILKVRAASLHSSLIIIIQSLMVVCKVRKRDEIRQSKALQVQENERHTIQNWLSPIQSQLILNRISSSREAGTGQWLLASHDFRRWEHAGELGQTLLLVGVPGAGKTVLAATIVEHLCEIGPPKRYTAFIFGNFQDKDWHMLRAEHFLLELTKQLVQQTSPMPSHAEEFYRRHVNGPQPTLKDVLRLLDLELEQKTQVFFVVDALDEIPENVCETVVSELMILQSKHKVNLLFTSRQSALIKRLFRNTSTRVVRASSEDIEAFLAGQMSRLPDFVMRSPELQDFVKSQIHEASMGR
jgi:hypothetical protein